MDRAVVLGMLLAIGWALTSTLPYGSAAEATGTPMLGAANLQLPETDAARGGKLFASARLLG